MNIPKIKKILNNSTTCSLKSEAAYLGKIFPCLQYVYWFLNIFRLRHQSSQIFYHTLKQERLPSKIFVDQMFSMFHFGKTEVLSAWTFPKLDLKIPKIRKIGFNFLIIFCFLSKQVMYVFSCFKPFYEIKACKFAF